VLKNVINTSDLGVTIDNKLSFCDHIINITRKAHSKACLILRCFVSKNSKNRQWLLHALKVYVRPLLEYNSPL
jgi:hypothetical protein